MGIRELLLFLFYIIFRKWILKWNLFYDLNVFNNLNIDFLFKKKIDMVLKLLNFYCFYLIRLRLIFVFIVIVLIWVRYYFLINLNY